MLLLRYETNKNAATNPGKKYKMQDAKNHSLLKQCLSFPSLNLSAFSVHEPTRDLLRPYPLEGL